MTKRKSEHSLRLIDSDSDSTLNCKTVSKTHHHNRNNPTPFLTTSQTSDYFQTAEEEEDVSEQVPVTPIANKYSFIDSPVDTGGLINDGDSEANYTPKAISQMPEKPKRLLAVQHCSTPLVTTEGLGKSGTDYFMSTRGQQKSLTSNDDRSNCSGSIYTSTPEKHPDTSALKSSLPEPEPEPDVRSQHSTTTPYSQASRTKEDESSNYDGSPGDSTSIASTTLPSNNNNKKAPRYNGKKKCKNTIITVLIILLTISVIMNAIQSILKPSHDQTDILLEPQPNQHPEVNKSPVPAINYSDPEIQNMFSDSSLKPIFYGLNYSPQNSTYLQCNISQKKVAQDIATLSQMTSRIKLYSTDCYQVEHVIAAINGLNVNMTISMGVWLDRFSEVTVRQLANMRRILKQCEHNLNTQLLFNSIILGHEVLFREDFSDRELIGFIDYVKQYLERKGINIPVGTSEVAFKWSPGLASHVDIMAVNIQPFFGGAHVNQSLTWTYDYILEEISPKRISKKTDIILSEIGWPSGGESVQSAHPGVKELQIFLNKWACANHNNNSDIGWYWHQAFDDAKGKRDWGILHSNTNKLKFNISLPQC